MRPSRDMIPWMRISLQPLGAAVWPGTPFGEMFVKAARHRRLQSDAPGVMHPPWFSALHARLKTERQRMNHAFNTLTAARDIERAGLDRQAAEAIAGAIRSVQGDLATKADLSALEQSLKADMGAMEQSLRADMSAMEQGLRADMSAMEQGLKADMSAMEQRLEKRLTRLEKDLLWMKAIGGAILVTLVLPLVQDFLSATSG